MFTPSHGLVPASLTLAAICSAPATGGVDTVELVFAPAAESSQSLTIRTVLETSGGELEVIMDGQEVPSMYLPELDLQIHDERVLAMTETCLEGGDGAPAGWLRRYDELTWTNVGSMGMSSMGQEEEYPWDSEASSPFAGCTVRFERDGDDVAASVDSGDESVGELLEGLQAELGFAELLPENAVEVGDAWSVDGDAIGFLFEPGGDFGWDVPAEARAEMLPEVLDRSHSGELNITLTEIEDGLAICKVEGELERESTQPGDLSMVPVVDGDATDVVVETWNVEGDLVWNLQEHRVHALALEGEYMSATTTTRDPGQPGSTYESTFNNGGSMRIEVESGDARAIEAAGD